MFRNYLSAALRNLARSRGYAAISIVGLAIGICVALLSFLVLRNQLTFDRFIRGYERLYLVVSVLVPTGYAPDYSESSNHRLADQLRLTSREIDATTRLADEELVFRRGDTRTKEHVYWADPNALDLLRLPVFAGDARTALRRPDGMVLPRSVARKYFGRDDPIGATLHVGDAHPMTVTAVIEDLPPQGTQLQTGILLSGLASWSTLTQLDNEPPDDTKYLITVRTYLRLAPGASIGRVRDALVPLARELWPKRPHGLETSLELVRLDRVHVFRGLNPNFGALFAITASVGLIVLFVACVNYVNLATARASRRALEVAIRKAAGASRMTLIVQFLGESLLYVTLATGVAMALTEWLLPFVNAFMNSGAVFDYWRDCSLLGWIIVCTLALAILAGTYPAFVLSSFRPAGALKGAFLHSRSTSFTRQVLVALQFATLMALIVAAVIVYQQRRFATQEALRVPTDQHLMLRSNCRPAFTDELRRLPGVRGVACASEPFLTSSAFTITQTAQGTDASIAVTDVGAGLLELYDLRPIAGRFFSSERDREVQVLDRFPPKPTRGVINETAVRRLGFPSPAAALGRTLPNVYGGTEIIGVVKDFSVGSVERPVAPIVYVPAPNLGTLIDVKLNGRQIPETLSAIDQLWTRTGGSEPLGRFFLNDYIQDLYLTVLRLAQLFGAMAGIAVLLACLGLIGLSASTTARRTKEIGIRKAMGASRGGILRLMVWQFVKPVLWACAIAAPASAWLMSQWLRGFAYHIDLTPWPFIGATALALTIAVLTVCAHCYAVARARPVAALRYE